MVIRRLDELRDRFLETIRQYALNKLSLSGETRALKNRHPDYFLGLIAGAKLEENARDGIDELNRIETDHDNLRAALEWGPMDTAYIALSFRLLTQLARFWKNRGFLDKGRRRLSAFLARPGVSASTIERAELLCQAAWLAAYQSV